MGVTLATRAGYEPFGLPEVLQSISQAGNTSRVTLLYKTHPHPDDRLTKMGDAIGGRLDNVQGKTLDKRSEEHTSELQSLMRNSYAVFCLKKKKIPNKIK